MRHFLVASIKKIPVRLHEDFMLADGYAWSSELNFTPDSLYVSGSAEKVDSLEYAFVVMPTNKEFTTSLDEKLSLTQDLQVNYKWSEMQVHATQKISRYTQIELRLPIEVLDSVESIDVSVIPLLLKSVYGSQSSKHARSTLHNLFWVVVYPLIPSQSFWQSTLKKFLTILWLMKLHQVKYVIL